MTREELDSWGEAIALDAAGEPSRYVEQEQQADDMAHGRVCLGCGERFEHAQGRPTYCRVCGDGSGPATGEPDESKPASNSTNYVGASIGYFCWEEGCPSNPDRPQDCCPNCRAVLALLALLGQNQPHPADDPIGPEPAESLNDELHVDGRYYARSEDAAFWRSVRDAKRTSVLRRMARIEADSNQRRGRSDRVTLPERVAASAIIRED